eukprot:TRINITY_DN6288_c0_g1_i1.p1 TRINITY_DN6288_c0_g1~~TRINITY_DN6288_c0_g1_i1.p1  ORF type:complete len:960 (-),score=226.78 TRINITY_DN6288_c0_g1_i1:65-2857(-)
MSDTKSLDTQKDREFDFTQSDENHEAQFVVLHDPGLPNAMGSYHPNGSLYEKPLDLAAAQAQHARFRAELEKAGCKVMTVREILAMDCDTDVVARVKLEDLATSCLTYKLIGDAKQLTNKEIYLMSDEYKREVVEKMDTQQLVEIVLTRPTIYLAKADKDTELSAQNYTFQPLSNLVFCRDQQITTAAGVVMARPRAKVRAREVSIMKFCFQKLRVPIIGEVKWPGTLEGGDFFPAGNDLCMVGVGLRSNMYAVQQLLDQNLWGTKRVAVVKDYFDQDQQRMHLDTVFNIIGTRVCLLLETVMGASSPRRRLVDEYVQVAPNGPYKLARHDVEFSQYLKEEGYKIIPCTEEMQFRYGCNGLNLGRNTLITVDKLTAKHIARSDAFSGRIIVIDFENITNMYGSVHCCSQVISRRDPSRISHVARMELAGKMSSAVRFKNSQTLYDLIYSHGADPSASDYDSRTALHVAARDGYLDAIKVLISAGANINAVDAFNNTPLDEAVRGNQTEAIKFLKEHGAKTFQEAKEHVEQPAVEPSPSVPSHDPASIVCDSIALSANTPLRFNSSKSVVLIAPDNFNVNKFTAADNALMAEAAEVFDRTVKELPDGQRGVYHMILREFSELHNQLKNTFGMDVFLFTHETFEMIPDAMFVRDWFSTHSAEETGGEPTMVLYSMRAPTRRGEKKDSIVRFLNSGYKRIINLTPCESGKLEVMDHFEYGMHSYVEEDSRASSTSAPDDIAAAPRGLSISVMKKDPVKPFEAGTVVFDRAQKIAFAASPVIRLNDQVLELWASQLNYKIVRFRLKTTQVNGRPFNHHTRPWLALGTHHAVVCTEVVADDDKEMLLSALSLNGTRKVIEVTLEQALSYAANGIQEVMCADGSLGLVMSQNARKSLTDEQFATLSSTVAKIAVVEFSLIEKLGGGSISGASSMLF